MIITKDLMIGNIISFTLNLVISANILGTVSPTQTCSSCIQNLGLAWCQINKELNTTIYSRCLMDIDDSDEWRKWCSDDSIYTPANQVDILEDEAFSDPTAATNGHKKVIQIKPQVVTMKLSPGKEEILNVTFKYVRGYSLELYYLMDMSKSMEQDKETIIKLADDLATQLKTLTPNLKLGFGSFLDKVMLPYLNTYSSWLENSCREDEDAAERSCRAPYGFQNILSLTNDTEQFIESVGKAKLSTNWDDPEGGLDALLQAMVCQEEIGWQTAGTRHLIVYVSGSAFKYGGDGKLAGLTAPNDMQCHLNGQGMYDYSSIQDYPTISQIANLSKDRRMHVVFAVKEKVLPLYKAVSHLIAQSNASELGEDSANIIDIITNFYEDVSRTLILSDDSYKWSDVSVSYSSKCGEEDVEWRRGSSQCEDVDVNEEIQFQITFQLTKCLSPGDFHTITISPEGLEDKLTVRIESNCECDCEKDDNSVENAEKCTNQGRLACGVCICNEGFLGEHCECVKTPESLEQTQTGFKCKRPDDPSGRDCSGHGVCKCGVCECQQEINGNLNWMYQGTFCHCSNFDCPKASGTLCSNHGRCECNKCICDSQWTGDACNCDNRRNNCYSPEIAQICSGHGSCVCNQCICQPVQNEKNETYFGKYCEDCQSCEGRCTEYNDCIKCRIFSTGPLVRECAERCIYLDIVQMDTIEGKDRKECSYRNEDGCLVLFSYDPSVQGIVYVRKEPNCSEQIQIYVVVGSMMVLILFLGILLLAIWKCWVTLKDKREYKMFLNEYKQASFSRQEMNPIYIDPVTRVSNPLRGAEFYE